MKIYLAGGAVRDLLLGASLNDRDYLVTGISEQTFQLRFPEARKVGLAFPVYLIEGLEFAFPRASSLEEELCARDFTVNALLLDENGCLICHPQGLEDLCRRILRPCSTTSLADDPLRCFRAARFVAKLADFTAHPELLAAMKTVADSPRLASVAPDRVGQEVRKALRSARPGQFLRVLDQGNCLAPWFREFADGGHKPAGPPAYHDASVLEHTARTMDLLAGDELAVWMGLTHDLGKTITPESALPKHHGHSGRGEAMALELAERLRLPNSLGQAGAKSAKWHMIGGQYPSLRPTTKVDLLMDLHLSDLLAPFFSLVLADQGLDLLERAREDLRHILAVSLPKNARNLGAESGKRLRQLRAQALKNG